jgi:hypothetical protein
MKGADRSDHAIAAWMAVVGGSRLIITNQLSGETPCRKNEKVTGKKRKKLSEKHHVERTKK